MKSLLIIIASSLLLSTMGISQSHSYYVSVKGNDKNPGTLKKPFKTIQKAATLMKAGDTCFIREGVYRETVKPSGSGTADKPVVFTSWGSEKAIISGADIVHAHWKIFKGSIYMTSMPWTMGPGRNFVFVNGSPVLQARHPNVRTGNSWPMPPVTYPLSPLWPHAFGNFKVTKGSDIIKDSLDLLQNTPDYWKGAFYLGFHKWSWCLQSADVVASSNGQITVANKIKQWWFPDNADMPQYSSMWDTIQAGYLTNHIHALDKPGEWHWQNDTLYLWAENNANPSSLTVEAKKRQLAFDLNGLSYIKLLNLQVKGASVNMYTADNCTIDNCRLSYISHFLRWDDSREGLIDKNSAELKSSALFKGEAGIIIGGKNDVISNSIIEYSSGAGLYLNGYNTTVNNCIIHDCGYTTTYLGCIYIFNDHLSPDKKLGGHIITNNNLYNSGRANISVFGNKKQTSFDAMEISYNRIFDGCILSNDGGLFNTWSVDLGTEERKTQIHHNLFWDQWGRFWAGMVYPDNKSYKMDAHDNVIWFSDKNKYSGSAKFFKTNPPNDCTYHDNTELRNHAGGFEGLKNTDYPGGFFRTGATINVDSK